MTENAEANTTVNFERIKNAITFIDDNFRDQPTLEAVAAHVHLSPFHFQRMFSDWAGVSPKRFLQYTTVNHAKAILTNQGTLSEAAWQTGMSGTGRLHDLFINLEAMTPGEYKNGGASLHIVYEIYESPFGKNLVASTHRGICHLAFIDDELQGIQSLKENFYNANFLRQPDVSHKAALQAFTKNATDSLKIRLHVKGTPFQLKVWEALLTIPRAGLTSYGRLASAIGDANASRAVGSAVGANAVAYLIPCHRVIQSSGVFGNYRWGAARKKAILGWEQSVTGTE